MVRTRFAPSPTGYFHIGNARTGLFSFLYARKHKGSFILRIEDTDTVRSKPEYEQDILNNLKWLGINWDEGPDCGGSYGPYRQSERLELYETYLKKLYEKSQLYKCYCTVEELEKEKELLLLARKAPKYSGKCRDLSIAQQKECESQGRSFVLRFREPSKQFTVQDLVRGELSFDTNLLGDFILAKSFSAPLFNFAVIVDDYHMGITHVIRGEEHISNIPVQILVAESLGFSIPQFAHLPIILNQDRTKLSKRQNKVSLLDYRNEGYLPHALVNFMCLLGWNPGGNKELFTLEELCDTFELSDVNKSASIFDTQKLDWFNAHYLRQLKNEEFLALSIPYLEKTHFWNNRTGKATTQEFIEDVLMLEKDRIHKLSELPTVTEYLFSDKLEYEKEILVWKNASLEKIQESLRVSLTFFEHLDERDYTIIILEEKLKNLAQEHTLSNGELLWPLRVALSGMSKSPSPFELAALLGKEKIISRITHALQILQSTT